MAGEVIEDRLGLERGTVQDRLTPFVPWDLEKIIPN